MANRARRGGAAAMYADRQTEEIDLGDEENHELEQPASDDEPEPVIEEEEPEPPQEPDYSHEEPEEEPEPLAAKEVTDGLADLQKQLADMQVENEQLRAGQHRSEETELHSQQALIASGLARAKGMLSNAQANYAKHAAAGEWDKAATAQTTIAQAVADVREFEAAGEEVKHAIEEHRRAPRERQQRQPAANNDPFEASISSMSSASQAWCREHKADLTKSPTRGNLAIVGHQMALEEGLKVDTPEYFAFLDKHMGYEMKQPNTKQPAATVKQPKPTGKPRVAAPAGTRVAPSNGGTTEVKLSRAEVQMAQSMGMSVKEYAKNKAEIIRNGQDNTRSGLRYSQQTASNRR